MPYHTEAKWDYKKFKELSNISFFKLRRGLAIFWIIFELETVAAFLFFVLTKQSYLYSIFFGFLIFVFPFAYVSVIKDTYKRDKALISDTIKYTFSEDKFEIYDRLGYHFFHYTDLYCICETEKNFYIFQTKRSAFLIEKDNCSDGLISFLRSKPCIKA